MPSIEGPKVPARDSQRVFFPLVVPLLLAAFLLRSWTVDWDGLIGAHPDERLVVGLAETLASGGQLNPFLVQPGYSYGHLPVYLFLLLGGQDRLAAARLLTGLIDTGTVALVMALGVKLGGRRMGLLVGLFLSVMPLHVQQAHFAVVDSFLAFFVTAALLWATRLARPGTRASAILTGIWTGLALGCKAGAALLALPLLAALGAGPGAARRRMGLGLLVLVAALLVFGITNPFSILEFERFLGNVSDQAALATGAVLAPYTFQYHHTLPYLYPIAQQVWWGMGPGLALLSFGGLVGATWDAVGRRPTPAAWATLSWALPFFAFTGALLAKYPRYLLPLTPVLAIYAALAIRRVTGWRCWAGWGAAALALLPALLLSVALVASYGAPHPWIAASEWLRAHLPVGAVVAVEEWDHPLPLGGDDYAVRALSMYDAESPEKWDRIWADLAGADAVVVASRRGYGALANWPERFPLTADYYRALFAGELGFDVAACFGRWPRIGPLALADDPFAAADLSAPAECEPEQPVLRLPPLDESLVVYDHPLVVILLRSGETVGGGY
jgi:4-amino-4-deoxy-L-arabinose transferase-like glycosyltransferase